MWGPMAPKVLIATTSGRFAWAAASMVALGAHTKRPLGDPRRTCDIVCPRHTKTVRSARAVQATTVSTGRIPVTDSASHVGALQAYKGQAQAGHIGVSETSEVPVCEGIGRDTLVSPEGSDSPTEGSPFPTSPPMLSMAPRGARRCQGVVADAAGTYPLQNPSIGKDGRGASSRGAQSVVGQKFVVVGVRPAILTKIKRGRERAASARSFHFNVEASASVFSIT